MRQCAWRLFLRRLPKFGGLTYASHRDSYVWAAMMKKIEVNWKKFARDVKRARTAANLSLREAAPLASIDYTVWHRLEHGRPLTSVPAYLLICRWMKADPFSYLN
jgi:hypothetical protein